MPAGVAGRFEQAVRRPVGPARGLPDLDLDGVAPGAPGASPCARLLERARLDELAQRGADAAAVALGMDVDLDELLERVGVADDAPGRTGRLDCHTGVVREHEAGAVPLREHVGVVCVGAAELDLVAGALERDDALQVVAPRRTEDEVSLRRWAARRGLGRRRGGRP